MKRAVFALLSGWFAIAQQADYLILVEISQYTCGKPIQEARQVLSDILCGGGYGSIAIGTFYRKSGRSYIDWKTTPVLTGGGNPCRTTLQALRPRCDSVYVVHLLGALEEALRGSFVEASRVIVLASGMDATPGMEAADILKLARSREAQIHALSIGYLAGNDRAQNLLKRLSGQFEGGSGAGVYGVADPQGANFREELRELLHGCLSRPSASKSASPASVPEPPEEVKEPGSGSEKEASPSRPDFTLWILIGAGILLAIGLLFVALARRSPAKAAPVPAPPPAPGVQPLPLPDLRRLIIYYPHGTQEVQLSPSPAPISIGRAPDNTIVISDSTVSSRHARLYLQGSQWYIQDLGSTNGTFVNNLRVTQHPVQSGDQIRLGAIIIQIG